MAISPSSKFQFKDVSDINRNSVNTKKLLEQGSLKIGNHSYRVSLQNGAIAVERQHQNSSDKVKNFFSSAKEQFTHRFAEGSKFSRSDRTADVLNSLKNDEDYQAAREARMRKVASQQRPSVQPKPRASKQSAPARANSWPLDNTSRPAQQGPKLQSFSSFRQGEIEAARYSGVEVRDRDIRQKYDDYKRNLQWQHKAASGAQGKGKSKIQPNQTPSGAMSFDQFKERYTDQDRYHNIQTSTSRMKEDYARYKRNLVEQRQPVPTSPVNAKATTRVGNYDSLLSESLSRTSSAESRQSSADYYGHESDVSSHEQMMDDVDELMKKYLSDSD